MRLNIFLKVVLLLGENRKLGKKKIQELTVFWFKSGKDYALHSITPASL
jgi:hypothetical protein